MGFSIKSMMISGAAVFGLSLYTGNQGVALCFLAPVLYVCLSRNSFSALSKRGRTWCGFLAALLTVCCLIGYSIEITGSLILMYEDPFCVFRAAAGAFGYYVSFRAVLSEIVAFYGSCPEEIFCDFAPEESRGFASILYRHPFLTSLSLLAVFYIPYVFASYPAIFMGDTPFVLGEFFPKLDLAADHPVPYALMYYGVLKLGHSVFGSWNAGAFLFSLLQFALILVSLSAGIAVLIKECRLSWRCAVCMIVCYVIHPKISNYMMLATKDTIYAPFFFLFCIEMFIILDSGWTPRRALRLGASTLFVLIFRNESLYILLITFAVLAIARPDVRRKLLLFMAGCLIVHAFLFRVLFPAVSIEPGNRWEKLCIPIQTTGRVIMLYGNELNDEEKEAILGVVDFASIDEIGSTYSPDLADNLKKHFLRDASDQAFHRFMQTWKKLVFRYPKACLTAFLASYDDYFFPYTPFTYYSYWWSEVNMEKTNANGTDFSHPAQLERWRTAYEDTRETVFSYVPFSLLNSPGITTWALLLLLTLQIVYRQREELLLSVPFIVYAIVWLLGPVNGYYGRYQYPLLLCLPWLFLLTASRRTTSKP